MNWQKISIERLREYEARKQAVESIPEQIKTLELNFTSIRASRTDGTPTRDGFGNKREEALVNNIAMRDELKTNLEIAKREVETTEKGLARLTDEQRKVLYRFYISRSHGHIEALCEELCLEKSRVYKIKDEALKQFTMSCYGVVEV
jgi:hypothetical protein